MMRIHNQKFRPFTHVTNLVIFLGIVSFLSTSCKSNAYLTLMKPAQIGVPSSIKTIAIADRTTPENEYVNIIEGVLTGEGIGMDKEAVQKAIDGLQKVMGESPRFEVIRTTESLNSDYVMGNFPDPLPWGVVSHLCAKYKTDALLMIEYFDSDFIVTNGTKVVEKKDKDGQVRKVTEYHAEGVASVNLGFRLYDPSNKSVIDQQTVSNKRSWNAKGNSVKDAIAQLYARKDAVMNVSYTTGHRYGQKISPSWFTESRSFYKKDKHYPGIEAGKRQADVGEWGKAAEIWEDVANKASGKSAGKAAFNTALAYEVLGELDIAREWASRSYTDYGNKDGRDYVRIIDRRIHEEARLREQMEE